MGKKTEQNRKGGSQPFKAFCVGAIVETHIYVYIYMYMWMGGWLGGFGRECVPLVAKDKHFYLVRLVPLPPPPNSPF